MLSPLSYLYGRITAGRNWLYDKGVLRSSHSNIPIISIGNITAGGNGKTPLCAMLVAELAKRGFRPVILSRGFGGSVRGPHRVTDHDSPQLVGDEPVMLAVRTGLPVYVARSRSAGMREIERTNAGNIVILDDGFQHRAVARNVDIVTISISSPLEIAEFKRGQLLPLGRFRENRARALQRAHIVVLADRSVSPQARSQPIDEDLLRLFPKNVTVFRSNLESGGILPLSGGKPLEPQKIVAFAGIANPNGYFASLERLGFQLAGVFPFPDHHQYSERELRDIIDRHPNLTLVCTEKDAVKLTTLSGELRQHIAVLHVVTRVSPLDAFLVAVLRLCQGREQNSVVG